MEKRHRVVFYCVLADVAIQRREAIGHGTEEQSGQVHRVAIEVGESTAAGLLRIEELGRKPASSDGAVMRQLHSDQGDVAEATIGQNLTRRERVGIRKAGQ